MARSLRDVVRTATVICISLAISASLNNPVSAGEVVDNAMLNRALEQGTSPDVIYLKLKMSPCRLDDSLDALTLIKKAAEKGGWTADQIPQLQQKIMLMAAEDKKRRAGVVSSALTAFENDDPVECEMALSALRKEGHAIVPDLLDNLEQESDRKRAGLLQALTLVGEKNDTVIAQAQRLLNDPSRHVREEAARCVATVGGERMFDVLSALLSERDKPIDGACMALGDLGDAHAIAPLTHVLRKSSNSDTRVAAAVSLGQLRASTRDARSALLDAVLDEHDAKLREAAAGALVLIRERQTPEYIIKAFERYKTGRETILKPLAGFKCSASVTFLLQQLDNDTPAIRKAANEALKALTQENFATAAEWSSWWDLAKVRPDWIQVDGEYSKIPSPVVAPKSDDEPIKTQN